MTKTRFTPRTALLLLISAFFLLSVTQTLAADITVDEDCSLHNAILSANGSKQTAPLDSCENGNLPDESGHTGSDTITIDVAGTDDGAITLTSTLTVISDIVIEGGGFTISGDGAYQIFNILGGSLTVNQLTMTSGHSDNDGGAIAVIDGSLSLNNSVVSASSALGNGGGIYASNSSLSLIDSAISGNSIRESDPDAEESEGELPALNLSSGGGIYYDGTKNVILRIENSGIDSNASPANGGGLFISAGTATITNSTFGENTAVGQGGGIYNAGEATLRHVTVANNTASSGAGLHDEALMHIYNSVLSGNIEGDCSGTLNSNISNLIQDQSCGHEELTADPLLLRLAGLPVYYVPQEDSPALDAGHSDYCLPSDQRGIERPEGLCDIGAAELLPGSFSFQIQTARVAAAVDAEAQAAAEAEVERISAPTAPPPPAIPTCETLPTNVSVYGYVEGTQCQQRDANGIGNPIIVNYGFKMAIDLWGYIPPTGLRICFQDSGAIVLLDAAHSPRTIIALPTDTENGMTCADVDREGTAVLMPSEFLTSGLVDFPLENLLPECTITTIDILNLRDAPRGNRLAYVLNDLSFTPMSSAEGWYQISHAGYVGWISGDFVTSTGAC